MIIQLMIIQLLKDGTMTINMILIAVGVFVAAFALGFIIGAKFIIKYLEYGIDQQHSSSDDSRDAV